MACQCGSWDAFECREAYFFLAILCNLILAGIFSFALEYVLSMFGPQIEILNCFSSLFSVVPPNIDDSLSSSDVIVREGSNVTLRCRASGSPTPVVKWKRDSMEKIAINKSLVGKSEHAEQFSDARYFVCLVAHCFGEQ